MEEPCVSLTTISIFCKTAKRQIYKQVISVLELINMVVSADEDGTYYSQETILIGSRSGSILANYSSVCYEGYPYRGRDTKEGETIRFSQAYDGHLVVCVIQDGVKYYMDDMSNRLCNLSFKGAKNMFGEIFCGHSAFWDCEDELNALLHLLGHDTRMVAGAPRRSGWKGRGSQGIYRTGTLISGVLMCDCQPDWSYGQTELFPLFDFNCFNDAESNHVALLDYLMDRGWVIGCHAACDTDEYGYVLVQEREGKPFNMPGGKRGRGESLEDCIVRELYEEGFYMADDPYCCEVKLSWVDGFLSFLFITDLYAYRDVVLCSQTDERRADYVCRHMNYQILWRDDCWKGTCDQWVKVHQKGIRAMENPVSLQGNHPLIVRDGANFEDAITQAYMNMIGGDSSDESESY